MATQIERPDTSRNTIQARHPWYDWANGQWWEVLQGQDYDGTSNQFRATMRTWAYRNGYKTRVGAIDDTKVQFCLTKRPTTTDVGSEPSGGNAVPEGGVPEATEPEQG